VKLGAPKGARNPRFLPFKVESRSADHIIKPAKAGPPLITDMLLGVVGALVGGFLATFLGIGGVTGVNIGSIIIAVIGAVVALLVYRAVASRA
jgi:uncharacterized membrane protein YeaQ/YmgE (transglycosylase-associated protein family)